MYSRLSPLRRSYHGSLLHFLPSANGRRPGQLPQRRFFHSSSSEDDQPPHDSRLGFVFRELEGLQSLQPMGSAPPEYPERREGGGSGRGEGGGAEEVEISHPWPEWVGLMEKVLRGGYLDRYGVRRGSATASKDANRVRTACLKFARDRVDLIRCLSRKDIQIVVESGCPSLDRKVVNSGKRLRAHVGIEEGKVCSSCNLRGNCERAYLNAQKDERGRTVDIMRILLTYGLNLAVGSVENKTCRTKTVEESARRLLYEMADFSIKQSDSDDMTADSGKLSIRKGKYEGKQLPSQIDTLMKQGDWMCPKCNFLNFAKNMKCLRCDGLSQEKLKKFKEEYEHLPLKKGDWICNRCNYINFRRNAFCLKCDWKRPKALSEGGSSAAYQHEREAYLKPSRISFVRSEDDSRQYPVHLESAEEDSDFWSTSGDEHDNRSGISQHPIGKGRDQSETTKTRGTSRKGAKNGVSAMGSIRSGFLKFTESCSDDDMAGWFGHQKKDKGHK
ncbi:hypothetical protein Taro_031889 [Colocasia esculenta]|uniref:RanBP2-type domain-containing protein n=1 Tax=Colocasia esculenta TaxID=4460 RepID=A0A843W7S0_COLES|nr:hypothetical protein [Colocasia esculenta]